MSRGPGALREVAWVFLRLGVLGFGGPAAHVAMMEEEVVRRRGWLAREEFLDLLAATHLIPGPNSTEMALHLGARRAGSAGLVVAGACFILPAAVIVTGLAWAYLRYGSYPRADAAMMAIQPVVVAVIAHALGHMGHTALRSPGLLLLAAGALAANLAGVSELRVLAAAGVVAWIAHALRRPRPAPPAAAAIAPPGLADSLAIAGAAAAATPLAFGLGPLFLVFFKIGAVLFGSGYVLVAFLRGDLVERLGWLSERQLLDAVAVGQFTPGPLFTTATFIGYQLAGLPGAGIATVAIFLPAFVFVAVSGPLVPRLRRSPTAAAVLGGLVAAALGLMASVALSLGRGAITGAWSAGLAMLAAVLLVRFRISSAWLVLGAGLLGAALGP